MPAKRIIILKRSSDAKPTYSYVLWADVPAGNQLAYKNPKADSVYENISTSELQDIRNGLVAEEFGTANIPGDLSTVQTWLEGEWTKFQNKINSQTIWAEYGKYWDGALWQISTGVPMGSCREEPSEKLPSYVAISPLSSFAANKFHFVLFNNASILEKGLVVKVRLVSILPGNSTVTGAAPSVWSLRRRENPTTAPSGGAISIGDMDSNYPLSGLITAHNAPTTAPAGGIITLINEFVPQADEIKLSTADSPTRMTANPFGGQIIYRAMDVYPAKALAIRSGQTLEVQQSGTGGTGNCKVLCIFTLS